MHRALSIVLALAALVLLGWVSRTGVLRDLEGVPTGDLAPALSGVGLLGLAAWGAARRWGAALGWALLLAAGQLALFRLLTVGRDVAHANVSLSAAGAEGVLPLVALGVQALAVASGLWRARRAGASLLRHVGPARVAVLVALGLATSVAFFTDLESWVAKSAFVLALHLVALGNVFLIAQAWSTEALAGWRSRLDAVLGRGALSTAPGTAPGTATGAASGAASGSSSGTTSVDASIDRFVVLQALAATLLTAGLAFFVYERHPHVPDEVVYLMHAEYLAEGRLTLPAPPVPAGFEVDLMLLDGERWFCPVPPGWPAVLAIGAALGAPWLVNPVLAGVAAFLLHLGFRELFGRPTARAASLLLLASPWFLFMGMNFMPHALTLAATSLVLLGVARARARRHDVAWALAAGAAIGVVALIRPLEGLILAAAAGLWSLGLLGKRLRPAAILGLVASAGLVGALVLPYNRALTGRATKFPIMDYVDKVYGADKNALGFGDDRGLAWGGLDPFPGHHLRDVLVNAQFNLTSIDQELLGWACGALLPLGLLLLRRRWSQGERALVLLALLVVLAHSFYWFSGGPDFGARYWYLVLPACLALLARGLLVSATAEAPSNDARLAPEAAVRGAARALAASRPGEQRTGRLRLLATATVVAVLSATTFLPWRIFDRYVHYRGMRPDVRELIASGELGRSLVLIRGRRHPDYASAAIYNGTDLERDGPVFAWDRSAQVRLRLLEHYRDRAVWVFDGPTRSGRGYERVLGPLSVDAPELAEEERGVRTPGEDAPPGATGDALPDGSDALAPQGDRR